MTFRSLAKSVNRITQALAPMCEGKDGGPRDQPAVKSKGGSPGEKLPSQPVGRTTKDATKLVKRRN